MSRKARTKSPEIAAHATKGRTARHFHSPFSRTQTEVSLCRFPAGFSADQSPGNQTCKTACGAACSNLEKLQSEAFCFGSLKGLQFEKQGKRESACLESCRIRAAPPLPSAPLFFYGGDRRGSTFLQRRSRPSCFVLQQNMYCLNCFALLLRVRRAGRL